MKTFRLTLLLLVLWLGSSYADAAIRIEVVYKEKFHKVIDVKGTRPVIEVEGKRRTLSRSKIRINRNGGDAFGGGSFELKNRQLRSKSLVSMETGDEFNAALDFKAQIKSSVDLKNNFIAIELISESGKRGIILAELPNFKADKWTRVGFDVQTYKVLSGGSANHYIFTNGYQVLPQGQFLRQEPG